MMEKEKYEIGRNDKCPCGSGKKFKKCCINKEDNETKLKEILSKSPEQAFKELLKESRIKHCIHPLHSECSEKIVRAHALQNNKILKQLSDDGKVLMPLSGSNYLDLFDESIGRKKATIFTGFCSKHDKETFADIEDNEFKKSDKQIFLYFYRAFSFEYHNKLQALEIFRNIFKLRPSLIKDDLFRSNIIVHEEAVEDFLYEKKLFDAALVNNNFDIFKSVIWEFSKPINFAFTGFESFTVDFNNEKVQNLITDKHIKHFYYAVFSENGTTYALIGTLADNYSSHKEIFKRLESLNEEERMNYINNIALAITDNFVIKPSSWNKLSKEEQNNLKRRYAEPTDSLITSGFIRDRFKKATFDLFNI